MTTRSLLPALALVACALASCSGDDPTGALVDEPPVVVGDPAAGMVAFGAECASCHATGDGLDLAFFDFTDTTIVRRAVAHVDTATALDIVAHINTLGVHPEDRHVRIFQPGTGTITITMMAKIMTTIIIITRTLMPITRSVPAV